MNIRAESLTYWFFRLNGFLTIVNFVVHADQRGESGTDADILGVRFPYRAELFNHPMEDYHEFKKISSRPYIAIAEVKRGLCDLNGPWTQPKRRNIHRVLRAIGIVPLEDIDNVAAALYSDGVYESNSVYISLVSVGERPNNGLREKYPLVPQILWKDILAFIHQRFRKYRNVKTWHPNWDEDGHNLWDTFEQSRNDLGMFQQRIVVIP